MANIYEDLIDPPQSRIEERLRRIEKMIEEGGGGGGGDDPKNTATEEDIQDIKDHVWNDDSSSTDNTGSGTGNTSTGDDDEATANDDDIDSIKDSIWGN